QVARHADNEARRLLNEAEQLQEPQSGWWEQIAIFRAQIGDAQRARQLCIQSTDAKLPGRVEGILADRAIADPQRGLHLISEDHRHAVEHIRQAFEHYEKGNDAAARELLQGIGLQSPLLEWKVLLRGLLAYSTNDDQRALENWSRLDPERLPH